MKNYIPRAGSLAERAIEYLREHGATANTPLSEALEVGIADLPAALVRPVECGLVVKEKRGGLIWWSEGNGAPPARPEDDDDDRPLPATKSRPSLTDGVDIDKLLHANGSVPNSGLGWCAPADGSTFTCALWNDGRLQLAFDAETMTLSVDHTRELLRYLERMAEATA